MTIEEKAKAYDEAFKRAKAVWRFSSNSAEIMRMEEIFPELGESEDERIREALIKGVESCKASGWTNFGNNVDIDVVLAWLEKQDDKSTTLPKWKYKNDNTPLLRDSIVLNKYGCVAKSPSGAIISDAWVLDYNELAKLPKEELEKQGEQKQEWSEEDDYNLQCMIAKVTSDIQKGNVGRNNELIDWLKSLKDRMKGKED